MHVAKLCDAKESEENIKQLANDIEEKYGEEFSKKHEQLFEFAKSYVNKHNLNVKFDWANHK